MFEFDGQGYTKAEMLASNKEDAELCEWIERAQVWQSLFGVTRVS